MPSIVLYVETCLLRGERYIFVAEILIMKKHGRAAKTNPFRCLSILLLRRGGAVFCSLNPAVSRPLGSRFRWWCRSDRRPAGLC